MRPSSSSSALSNLNRSSTDNSSQFLVLSLRPAAQFFLQLLYCWQRAVNTGARVDRDHGGNKFENFSITASS
jgi:hypothetical protein